MKATFESNMVIKTEHDYLGGIEIKIVVNDTSPGTLVRARATLQSLVDEYNSKFDRWLEGERLAEEMHS